MTRRHGYKRLVRDRMARTGESYSTARQHLLAKARADRTDVAVVIVPVSEISRAVRFYTEVLGAEPVGVGDEWTELQLGGIRVALSREDGGGMETGLALLVDDLEHTVALAVDLGGSGTMPATDTACPLFDPDGNSLRIMQAAARQR